MTPRAPRSRRAAARAAGAAAPSGLAPPRVQFQREDTSDTVTSAASSEASEAHKHGRNIVKLMDSDPFAKALFAGNASARETSKRWSDVSTSMTHDEEVARPPARSFFDILFRKHDHPPKLVELYALNPDGAHSRRALHGPSICTRIRRAAAAWAVVSQREMERSHALERQPARPYKHDVLLQEHGVRRMTVRVHRQWLLHFADGRVAFFVHNPARPDEPPLFVPVLRIIREREAWMNMRLTRRAAHGADEPGLQVGGRYNTNSGLLAEYELVRTDGRVLTPDDVLTEPLGLHDEIGKLKREARARRLDAAATTAELSKVCQRLPRHYSSVGVRVYNPKKAQWKLQVLWAVMIGSCVFLIFVFFSCIINYWEHVEAVGTDTFLQAYLINTLLIQAFACEFREIFNVVFANIILREVLMLFCCLRCASATQQEHLGLAASRREGSTKAGAAITRDAAARARRGEARGLMHHLSQMRESVRESITGLLAPPKPRLLLAGSEEMLFLALRTALTKHTLALSQLRAAKRAWRYQHIFSAGGPGSARDELIKGLDAARESPEWVQLRHLRIREHIRALVESEHATVNSVQQTYANQLATLLTSLASSLLAGFDEKPTAAQVVQVKGASYVKPNKLAPLPDGLPPGHTQAGVVVPFPPREGGRSSSSSDRAKLGRISITRRRPAPSSAPSMPPSPPPSPPQEQEGGGGQVTEPSQSWSRARKNMLHKSSTARPQAPLLLRPTSSAGSAASVTGGGAKRLASPFIRKSTRGSSHHHDKDDVEVPPTAPTDPAPRFMPGRAGVTQGFLLPFAKELQFTFEEPPDEGTAEADRYHALMLLSLWEEMTEAQELAAYWAQHTKHADAQRHPDKHKPSCSRDPASFMRTAAGGSTLDHGSVTQKRVDEALASTMPARATSVRRLAALEAPPSAAPAPAARASAPAARASAPAARASAPAARAPAAVRAASKPGMVPVRRPLGSATAAVPAPSTPVGVPTWPSVGSARQMSPPLRQSMNLASAATAAELAAKLKKASQKRKKPPPMMPPGMPEHGPDLATIERDELPEVVFTPGVKYTADAGELSD